jgi:hypothetical protein
MDSTARFLQQLCSKIAEEEFALYQSRERIRQLPLDPEVREKRLNEASRLFNLKVQPVRDELDYVVKMLAEIEARKPQKPISVTYTHIKLVMVRD